MSATPGVAAPTEPPPRGSPWDLPLDEAPFVFLDLEMTGLDLEADRICEVAALRVRGGREEGALVSLVAPGVPVGTSESVHGLSDATLAAAPRLDSLREPLASLLEGAIVVGHAVGYDLCFLQAAAARGELHPPPTHTLDTRALARRAWHRAGYGLHRLSQEQGTALPTHRAEADARACWALFEALRVALRASTPRQLWQAQPSPERRGFRDDVEAVLRAAVSAGHAVRLAYRVPGRDAFEDELEQISLTAEHAEGRLRERAQRRSLRGDRVLWAEPLAEASD